METWRWIDYGPSDGATHMAIDRAVLEHAGDFGRPTIRTYSWVPPAISLGYHQPETAVDLERCRAEGVDVVRRPTGGRAVFHAMEVTYSVVMPGTSAYAAMGIGELYRTISEGLARGIRKLGVPAELEKRSVDLRAHYQDAASVSCFSAAARHEILVDERKLVGSAQRRLSGGMLQHGSILTGDAHLDLCRFLAGMNEGARGRMRRMMSEKTATIGQALGREAGYDEVVRALRQGLEEALSISLVDGELESEETEMLDRLRIDSSILSTVTMDVLNR